MPRRRLAAADHVVAVASSTAALSYSLSGQRFNGLSQAVGYGDDAAAATNYPLVRIRHLASGDVRYCRTFGPLHHGRRHRLGDPVSTNFVVPFGIADGAVRALRRRQRHLVAVRVRSTWSSFRWPFRSTEEIWARLIGSLADGDAVGARAARADPVDPWGPKVAREAGAAQKKALDGPQDAREARDEVFAERRRRSARGRGRARRGERGRGRGGRGEGDEAAARVAAKKR